MIKVYETTSDIYEFDNKWAIDCRVMHEGADDFSSHRFTFTDKENAVHFLETLGNLGNAIEEHMQALAEELYFFQTMLDEGEPYITLVSAEEETDDGEFPAPAVIH